jgi:hypothetical protein
MLASVAARTGAFRALTLKSSPSALFASQSLLLSRTYTTQQNFVPLSEQLDFKPRGQGVGFQRKTFQQPVQIFDIEETSENDMSKVRRNFNCFPFTHKLLFLLLKLPVQRSKS